VERGDIVETLASFALFADLSRPELEAVAHMFEEEFVPVGKRVVRQGFGGTGFYVIVEGEASVVVDGTERAKIGRGDFFGEISILLDEPPTADVIALTALRCVVLPRAALASWLIHTPTVSYRLLQAMARRLRNATAWRN